MKLLPAVVAACLITIPATAVANEGCDSALQTTADALKAEEGLSVARVRAILSEKLGGDCEWMDPFKRPAEQDHILGLPDPNDIDFGPGMISDDKTISVPANYPCVASGSGAGSIEGNIFIPILMEEPLSILAEPAAGSWQPSGVVQTGASLGIPGVWGVEGEDGSLGVVHLAKVPLPAPIEVSATCVDKPIIKCADLNPWAPGQTCVEVGKARLSCSMSIGGEVFSEGGVIHVTVDSTLVNPACD